MQKRKLKQGRNIDASTMLLKTSVHIKAFSRPSRVFESFSNRRAIFKLNWSRIILILFLSSSEITQNDCQVGTNQSRVLVDPDKLFPPQSHPGLDFSSQSVHRNLGLNVGQQRNLFFRSRGLRGVLPQPSQCFNASQIRPAIWRPFKELFCLYRNTDSYLDDEEIIISVPCLFRIKSYVRACYSNRHVSCVRDTASSIPSWNLDPSFDLSRF